MANSFKPTGASRAKGLDRRWGRALGITVKELESLGRDYRKRWGVKLLAIDGQGRVCWGQADRKPARDAVQQQKLRQFALEEALRWGEPTVTLAARGAGHGQRVSKGEGWWLWAMPLMLNATVLGGLLAMAPEQRMIEGRASKLDVQQAAADLKRQVETRQWTNAAFLQARQAEYLREQKRAEAIHVFKAHTHYNLRSMYLLDEPELVATIRRGDRGAAREILNRLLAAIHHHAGERLDLIKSFFMELVVTMCRSAVEAGGASEELLGTNFTSISELSQMQSQEELAPWLHQMLERIMDAIHRHRVHTPDLLLAGALDYIAAHCHQDISRDEAAQAVHLSPGYFSRLFKRSLGQTFTQVLNQKRVEKAADLLVHSDKELKRVALESGFGDQSYFTKVFHRYTDRTPREYRLEQRRENPGPVNDQV